MISFGGQFPGGDHIKTDGQLRRKSRRRRPIQIPGLSDDRHHGRIPTSVTGFALPARIAEAAGGVHGDLDFSNIMFVGDVCRVPRERRLNST